MSKVSFGESEVIEFKESLSEREDAAETLCGFANQNGGIVYIGIENNRKVRGISNVTEKTIRDLSQYIFDNLEPQKIISVIKKSINNLDVIKITIEKSPTPYHTFRKKP